MPLADLPDDLSAHVQIGQQLAVMVVEDDVLDADPTAGLLRLGAPPCAKLRAALLLMAGIAVGDRDEAHVMPGGRPLRGHAACVQIAVVGMRTERDDVQWPRGLLRHRPLRSLRGQRADHDDNQRQSRVAHRTPFGDRRLTNDEPRTPASTSAHGAIEANRRSSIVSRQCSSLLSQQPVDLFGRSR